MCAVNIFLNLTYMLSDARDGCASTCAPGFVREVLEDGHTDLPRVRTEYYERYKEVE